LSLKMEDKCFEIRVALVGYVSVGKSTVLNALLGDNYSEVQMRRTTAAVNFFRVQQPQEDTGIVEDSSKKSSEPVGEHEQTKGKPKVKTETTRTNNNDSVTGKRKRATTESDVASAEATHAEISSDNRALRVSDTEDLKERFFDVRVEKPICQMRKDTKLVLIDIPGMNEAGSSRKYKNYVESNWNSFDCVVVVMDAGQGVNSEEQVELLKFVNKNNTNKRHRHIPTIILGNKVDDPEDLEGHELVQEAREKTSEIFGPACRKDSLKELLDIAKNFEYDKSNTNKAVFIPISAMNAFIYRKASNLTLDGFREFDKNVIDKIGRDEVGRKWKKMKVEEKVNVIRAAISDPDEYKERLAGTNFDNFLIILTYFIGGPIAQRALLTDQIDVALNMMSQNSDEKATITENICAIFKKSNVVGRSTHDLKEFFWNVYEQCEDESFEKLEKVADPGCLLRLQLELEQYYNAAVTLGWDDEPTVVKQRMENLVRRMLNLVIKTKNAWCMKEFLRSLWHENPSGGFKMKKTNKCWKYLSPQDWITILFSVTLVSKNIEFCQRFGKELSSIDESLLYFRMRYGKCFDQLQWADYDSSESDYMTIFRLSHEKDADSDGNHSGNKKSSVRVEMINHVKEVATKVHMPRELSECNHWGHIAWRYVRFLCKTSAKGNLPMATSYPHGSDQL